MGKHNLNKKLLAISITFALFFWSEFQDVKLVVEKMIRNFMSHKMESLAFWKRFVPQRVEMHAT